MYCHASKVLVSVSMKSGLEGRNNQLDYSKLEPQEMSQ